MSSTTYTELAKKYSSNPYITSTLNTSAFSTDLDPFSSHNKKSVRPRSASFGPNTKSKSHKSNIKSNFIQSLNLNNPNNIKHSSRLDLDDINNRSSKRRQELTEHLKRQCKNYKLKYELAIKDKNLMDDKYTKNLMKCEEWKTKFKSAELNLNHLSTKFKNEMKEQSMSHQREISRIQLISENKSNELQNKYDQQCEFVKKLKSINNELTIKNEELENKLSDSKCYQSSLENKLETSMKRAMEVQGSLSLRLNTLQKEGHENDNKYQNDIERINNLLKIKQSDIQFLRAQLKNERDGFQMKFNEKNKNHALHVRRLETEINSLTKELQNVERQKEEFARSSQIATDSLSKAVKFKCELIR